MLIKNKLLFVRSEDHEFDPLIKNLEKDFSISSCKCSYADICFYTDDFRPDLVICSLKGLERNDIVYLVEKVPNMFLFYSADDLTDIKTLSARGLKYYAHDLDMSDEGGRFIRIICNDLPFRYAEFKEKIFRLTYDCNMDFKPGAFRSGFTYAVESIRYVLFSECSRLNFSSDVYSYLASKFNTTIAGVDNAMRRYVKYVWSNREELRDLEYFPECAAGDEKPIVSDFIFEISDRIFFEHRQDFYRYFSAIHK